MAADDGQGAPIAPEELDRLLVAVARIEKRRRIMLAGYVVALVVILVGMVGALYVYGLAAPGQFVSWVFLVPPGLAGAVLWAFGRWVKRS